MREPGASAIRQDWIVACEAANGPLFEEREGYRSANFSSLSQRPVAALQRERQSAQARLANLNRILG